MYTAGRERARSNVKNAKSLVIVRILYLSLYIYQIALFFPRALICRVDRGYGLPIAKHVELTKHKAAYFVARSSRERGGAVTFNHHHDIFSEEIGEFI